MFSIVGIMSDFQVIDIMKTPNLEADPEDNCCTDKSNDHIIFISKETSFPENITNVIAEVESCGIKDANGAPIDNVPPDSEQLTGTGW